MSSERKAYDQLLTVARVMRERRFGKAWAQTVEDAARDLVRGDDRGASYMAGWLAGKAAAVDVVTKATIAAAAEQAAARLRSRPPRFDTTWEAYDRGKRDGESAAWADAAARESSGWLWWLLLSLTATLPFIGLAVGLLTA